MPLVRIPSYPDGNPDYLKVQGRNNIYTENEGKVKRIRYFFLFFVTDRGYMNVGLYSGLLR